jgi:hypothetical protein
MNNHPLKTKDNLASFRHFFYGLGSHKLSRCVGMLERSRLMTLPLRPLTLVGQLWDDRFNRRPFGADEGAQALENPAWNGGFCPNRGVAKDLWEKPVTSLPQL